MFCQYDETIVQLFFQCEFAKSIWSAVQIGSILYPPRTVANIFGNWLNGVDPRFKLFCRMGAIAVIWSLWLCGNDKVFNDKCASVMQVIYRCTATLRAWSALQRVQHRDLFLKVASRLEAAARELLSRHGCQHRLRIDLPTS